MSKTRRVVAMPPVEAISGKFALESEHISSEYPRQSKRYFGARIRKNTARNIFYFRKNANPAIASGSSIQRIRFAFASQWTEHTYTSPTMKMAAMMDFKNKVAWYGKRPQDYTFKGWIFAVRYQHYVNDPDLNTSSPEYNKWESQN